MSDKTQVTVQTSSASETEQVAQKIGKRLRGGEAIILESDLGGGKTTFVRGLAAGMGSKDHVASPTFMISKLYRAGKLSLHHLDFYRLSEPELMAQELAEHMEEPDGVVVIEWPGIVSSIIPKSSLAITIKETGPEQRQLSLVAPLELSYLMKDLA